VSLADGLVAPSGGSGSYFNSNSVLQESYTYNIQTGVDAAGYPVTMYPMATECYRQ
jgi:hypothetical protein